MMVRSDINALVRITTIVVAALALAFGAAPPAQAGGLPNCSVTGLTPCFEMVWVDKVQLKMTFVDLDPTPSAPSDVAFYVLAPQTDTPQGGPVPFFHDHVTSGERSNADKHDADKHDASERDVHYRGFLVFCSAEGMSSGACVPTMTQSPDGTLPFAKTVNGHRLTSVKRIKSAAKAGLLTVVDTGAVLIASLPKKRLSRE